MSSSAFTVGVAVAAAQSDQETATSTTTVVTPGRQQFHPSASKAWVKFTSVTTTAINVSYNVTSLTDNGTGDTTINFTTPFSSADYAVAGTCLRGSVTGILLINIATAAAPTASALRVTTSESGSQIDIANSHIVCFGDQ